MKFISNAFASFSAGFLTILLTYRYDLALNRKSSSLTNEYNKMSDLFEKQGNKNNKIFARFDGFVIALIEGGVNGLIILLSYSSLTSWRNINSGSEMFIVSFIIGLSASLLSYPLNTYKKIIQLNGFNSEFKTILSHDLKSLDMKTKYSGVHLHIIRSILQVFIQLNIINLIKKNKINKV